MADDASSDDGDDSTYRLASKNLRESMSITWKKCGKGS